MRRILVVTKPRMAGPGVPVWTGVDAEMITWQLAPVRTHTHLYPREPGSYWCTAVHKAGRGCLCTASLWCRPKLTRGVALVPQRNLNQFTPR